MKRKLSASIVALKQQYDEADRQRDGERWARICGHVEYQLCSTMFDALDHLKALEDAAELMFKMMNTPRAMNDEQRQVVIGILARLRDETPAKVELSR